MYNIAHYFEEELIVPIIAIEDNMDFIMDNDPKLVTADFIESNIISQQEIHVLSEEAGVLIWKLYKLSTIDYLKRWYSKYPYMSSMIFIHLKLEKNVTTEVISTEIDRCGSGCNDE